MCRRVFSRFGRAPSTGRLAFLRRVVALRAACAGLAVLIHVMCGTAATSDGGKETVHARSYWCGGSIPRGRWLRERDRVGYGRIGFRISVGGSDHRDWLSTHSAVRRAIVSFFLSYFLARVGHPAARATQPMGAGGRGRAEVALARRGEVAKARAALVVWSSGAPRGQLPCVFLEP